jgi:hypothetical protein
MANAVQERVSEDFGDLVPYGDPTWYQVCARIFFGWLGQWGSGLIVGSAPGAVGLVFAVLQ